MTTLVLFLAVQSDLWKMDSDQAVGRLVEQMRQGLDERRRAAQALVVLHLLRPESAEAIRSRIKSEEDGRIRARLEWALEQTEWRPDRDFALPALEASVIVDDVVIGRSPAGPIGAVSIQDGRQLWTAAVEMSCTVAPLAVGGNHVLISSSNNVLQCREIRTGKLAWQAGSVYTGEQPVICGGAWISRSEAEIWAYDLKTGRARWSVRMTTRAMAAGERRLLVTDVNKTLLAIDAETGKTVWTQELPFLGAAVIAGGSRVFAAAAGTIVAYDEAVGQRLWTLGDTGALPDCVSATDESLFAVDTAQNLHCIDSTRGRILWTRRRDPEVKNEWARRPAAALGPVVFVNLPQGGLAALRRETGAPIQGTESIGKGRVIGSDGSTVLVSNNGRVLYYRLR